MVASFKFSHHREVQWTESSHVTKLYPFIFFQGKHGISKCKSLDANPGQCLTIILYFLFLKQADYWARKLNDLYVSSSDFDQQFSWHAH